MTPLVLRDYQAVLRDAITAAWDEGDLACLAVMATGLGKTATGIDLLMQEADPAGRCLWLAHRDRLLTQPWQAMEKWWPQARLGMVKAERREYAGARVVIASVQSLHARRLHELETAHRERPWTHVVVDEAHHAILDRDPETGDVRGNQYGRILTALRRLNPDLFVVGLTATPKRADGKGLGGCFPGRFGPDGLPRKAGTGCIIQPEGGPFDLRWGVRTGWLSPVRCLRVDTGTSLEGVASRGGDYVRTQLAEAVNTPARNCVVVESWAEHARGRPSVVFSVDVQHAHDLADAFRGAGIRAEAVWGAMPRDDRARVEAAFEAGEIDVVTNCDVWSEGVDVPSIAAVVHAAPTRSPVRYTQRTGRGTRLSPETGKDDLLILDAVDATRSAGLVTAADLRIPGAVDHVTGDSLAGLLCAADGCSQLIAPEWTPYCSEACRGKVRARVADNAPRDEHGRLDWRAVEIDLFSEAITWPRVGVARVLGLGDGRVVAVFPAWRAVVADNRTRCLEWLTFGDESEADALAAAERMVRRSGVHGRYLAQHRHAGTWAARQQASDRQASILRCFGFRSPPASSRDAQVLIDWCLSRRLVMEDAAGERLDPARQRAFAAELERRRVA